MIVEDKRGGGMDEDGFNDQFPVGMRVLAVDDNPICLKLLENLLRKCQYHVTATNQAIKALQMLRENRNKYDLVISDVNMPDMDGFKLLELVGLEMDLPVIMLSAHSDTKLVMKGITHGACDYLLKPVRIEELKNIWQHVIRRKKLEKDQNRSTNQDKALHGTGDVGQGSASIGNAEPNGKLNRKRKDQNEEEDEDSEENGHESEDPATQKKPRVVWSVELHRKFVAAVNQLGLDKAVPKKILDLMNVEGLTRENVASHLQKYRLYLKRISNVASQQANMVAAFGSKDSSYLRIGSLDGFGDFHTLAGSGRYSSASLSSYPAGGMLGRLNSSSSLSLRGITSSGVIQPAHSQSFSTSVTALGKLQPVGFPANQNANLFQGVPTSLEINQLQQNKGSNPIREFTPIENSTVFATTTSFPDSRVTLGSSSNSVTGAPSNLLTLQGNPQQTQSSGLLYNQSSMRMPSNPDSFGIGVNCPSDLMDHGRCNESWQSAGPLSKFSSNPMLLNGQLPPSNFGENASSSNPIGFSSSSAVSPTLDSSRDVENQAGLIGNIVQNMSYPTKQRWEEHKSDYNHNLRQTYGIINPASSPNGIVGPIHQSMDQSSAICIENINMPIVGQLSGGASSVVQRGDFEKSGMDGNVKPNANYLLDQTKSQDNFIQSSYESLDDLMSAMIKREQNDTPLMDGELGYGAYPLGSCI